ncbi:MAG: AAA family ATPase [Sulfitobacter sp.]
MTLANHDIERQVAEAVTSDPNQIKVLVMSRTPAIGQAMAEEMERDPAVSGSISHGTLSAILKQGVVNWSTVDFAVFEISDSLENDTAAVRSLLARIDTHLQIIAMSAAPITADITEALSAAGVTEILPVKAKPETPSAPAAPSAPETAAKGDVTIVMRARGGAGATTLAVNLAVAQAQNAPAGRTALVDLDIQNGTVALMLDLPDSTEASTLIKGQTDPDAQFLDRAMLRHESGMDVLCAPDIFAPLSALNVAMVAQLMTQLKSRYDHVIVDMPQAMVEWVEPLMDAASRVLVISDTTLPSVKRTRRLVDLIGEDHMTLPVRIVINGQARPRVKSSATTEIERLIGRPLNNWIPADPKAARRATDMGVPLQIGAKRSATSRAIAAFAQSIFNASEGSK